LKDRHSDQSSKIRFSVKESPFLKPEVSDAAHFRAAEKKHEKGFSGVIILAVILFVLFWVSVIFVVPYKQWSFDPAYLFESVSRNFSELFAFIFGTRAAPGISGKFLQCIAAMIAGCALASCGAVFQGSFRNVLAGPSTMGVMSGGTLGIMAYLLIFAEAHPEAANISSSEELARAASRSFFEIYAQQLFVFAGSILAVALVLGISMAAGKGRVSAPAMIISGTVFSSMISSFIQLIQYYMIVKDPSDTRLDLIRDMMLGNFNDMTSFRTLGMMCVPILICLIILLCIRNRLNLLSLGEEEATVMGMNVMRYRILMTVLCTVMTACVVSFCGRIGFMGFMIPLVGRKIAGPNMRYLIPASMLLGALLLLTVFDVAYFFGMQDSLNIFTSTIGCIVMICVLIARKGGNPGETFQGRGPKSMGIRP